jgi:hypothetical protein
MARAASDSLSEQDVATLRTAVAGGERPTVYFTAAAVGVQGGRSGKVTAIDEAGENDFIHVKPAGQADVLSFSPAELALSKSRQASGKSGSEAAGQQRAHRAQPARAGRESGAAPSPAKVTITVTSDERGEWRVDVVTGRRKPVRGMTVSAGAVAKAASALAPEVAEAIDAALAAAREQQRAKVERLREELETAQRTLDDLG